ncbi:MAG: glycosyltransferase family A protein [Acidobacteria bacterium]|nr:glycosyltransferase family A protein [Acidobacteriota bacterium]
MDPNHRSAPACAKLIHLRPVPSALSVSVVIPVRNGATVLDRCLAAVRNSTVHPLECIVVNDGSADESVAIAEAAGAMVLETARGLGPAAARNLGAARASGELLLFIDADVCLRAGTLARILFRFKRDPQLDALIGSYDDSPADPGVVSQYKNLLHHYVHQHGRRQAETFWTGCGAIRRRVFLAAGGFDESYQRPCIEDIQLGYRLRQAGHKIELDPAIQVKHLKRYRLGTLVRSDIFDRALPWTRLICGSGRMPNDLNLSTAQRVSAALVLLSLGLALLLPSLASLALAGVIWLNRDFFRFLARTAGWKVAAGGMFLHLSYYVYSTVAFAAGAFLHLAVDRRERPPLAMATISARVRTR